MASAASLAAEERTDAAPAIELIGISKSFGPVQANRDIHLTVQRGTIHGIVGESGCGKSTLGRLIMRLEEPTAGEVVFEGLEMQKASTGDMRKLRRDIQIVFQDPFGSLSPRMSVGEIIAENTTATAAEVTAAARAVGAFALTSGSKDAALLLTVPEGAYTAQIAGKANASGVILLEIYEVP